MMPATNVAATYPVMAPGVPRPIATRAIMRAVLKML